MKLAKTFHEGDEIDALVEWARVQGALVNSGDAPLSHPIRLTIEVRGERIPIAGTLVELGLTAVQRQVEAFVDFRADELSKPIRSTGGLKRVLSAFSGKPKVLSDAIENSMRQGWAGLFGSEKDEPAGRAMKPGDSEGGTF